MEMPGRKWQGTADDYRYGMNGQAKENAIFAGANSAEYWMYDSRTGRRWNIDPIDNSWQSPYACFNGNPIYYSDPLGLEGKGDGNKEKSRTKKREANANKKAQSGTYKEDANGKLVYTPNEKGTASGGATNGNSGSTGTSNGSQTKDNHKVIAFNEKKDNPISFQAAENAKIGGGSNQFAFFGHSSGKGFEYSLPNGKFDKGYDAATFDRVMAAYSSDWARMRANNEKITVTLYGCNMAAHSYITHSGDNINVDFTIAQKISILPNVTVIAADGYVISGLTMGKPAIQGISNYKGDGSWIKIVNGKEIIQNSWNYGPRGEQRKKINP